jgi:hypothetical protein
VGKSSLQGRLKLAQEARKPPKSVINKTSSSRRPRKRRNRSQQKPAHDPKCDINLKHTVGKKTLNFQLHPLKKDALYRVWFVADTYARYERLKKFRDILKHDSNEIKKGHRNERLGKWISAKQARQVMTLTQVELIKLEAEYSVLLLTIRPEETLECRYAMMRIDDGDFSKTKKRIQKCLAKLRFIKVELRAWTRDNNLFRKVLKHKDFNKDDLTMPHVKVIGKKKVTDWYEEAKGDVTYKVKNKEANANSIKSYYMTPHIADDAFDFALWKMVYPNSSYARYFKREGKAPLDTYNRLLKEKFTDQIRDRLTPDLEESMKGIRRDAKDNTYRTAKIDRGINHSGHGHQIPAWEAEKMVEAFFGAKFTTDLDSDNLYPEY